MALWSCVVLVLLGVLAATASAASPSAVAADAAATYDALELAASDAALDERDAMAEEGERELTEREAMRFAHELDSTADADEALDEDEVEVDVEQAADAAVDAEAESEDEDSEDLELMELSSRFGPFQAAANVMPYNMAVDAGHNFMNPFIRGYNPAYDGYTPQPGGMHWNNPNGPNWSPFHWSAPQSYWSVYPPQYASHYVEPGMTHAPGMNQFFGPNYYGGHNHRHSPDATYPYGGMGMHSMDPHVFGPHLDWPFGALTSDMDHVPGMGTGVNPLQRFPQFLEVDADSEAEAEAEADSDSDSESDAAEGEESIETEVTHDELEAVPNAAFDVDSANRVIPHHTKCVNCAYV